MKALIPLFRGLLVAVALAGTFGIAAAKLPVPPETPESKAKADDTAAKAAAAAKKEAEDLSRYQDKAVVNFKERPAK
jgi:hypothetical protein